MKKHGMIWMLVILMGTMLLSAVLTGCNKSDKEREHPGESAPKDHPAH